MKHKNVTYIKNDQHFIEELNATIHELEKVGGREYYVDRLTTFREIALKRQKLKMPQEQYLSLQRVLMDNSTFMVSPLGSKIADLAYYFALIYRL